MKVITRPVAKVTISLMNPLLALAAAIAAMITGAATTARPTSDPLMGKLRASIWAITGVYAGP